MPFLRCVNCNKISRLPDPLPNNCRGGRCTCGCYYDRRDLEAEQIPDSAWSPPAPSRYKLTEQTDLLHWLKCPKCGGEGLEKPSGQAHGSVSPKPR